jgi:steroid delta-isomerase-like uncharacterized protein
MGLVCETGPAAGETFDLNREVLVIGREEQSVDIAIVDPAISRRHARLTRQGNSYIIEDLKSSNGTFVNARRISEPVLLIEGDVVELGKVARLSYESLDNGEATVVMDPGLMTVVEPAGPPAKATGPAKPAAPAVDERQLAEAHRRLFARWFEELWNRKDYEVAYELAHPDFVSHGAGGEDVRQGPVGVIAQAQAWHSGFPDGRMSVDEIITEGEMASVRITFRGTHLGTFESVPATGNRVETTFIRFMRVIDGQVAEGWGEPDRLGILQQIGAIPGGHAGDGAESAEQRNKRTALRLVEEVWNRGNLTLIDELLSDSFTAKLPRQPQLARGRDAYRNRVAAFRKAFPDLQVAIRDAVAEGDRVVGYWTLTGTNTGSFEAMPASYRRVSLDGMTVYRLADGRVVQEWQTYDVLNLMQQLGAIPAAGGARGATASPPKADSIEEQGKAVFNRWFGEAWNAGHYSTAYEVIDPRMRVHGAGGQPVEMGPDGLIGLISTWRTAFPDGHMFVDGLVAEGDLVAALLTWRGTQRGDFYGIPASKKFVACTSIGIDRVSGGVVRDGWGELDMVGLMQTVGALPLVGPGAVAQGRSPEWGSGRGDPIGTGPSSDNKDVGKRFIASWNTPSPTAFLGLVDTGRYQEYNPVFGVRDANGALGMLATLRAAMPDLCFTQDQQMVISDGDIVVVHSVATGTHTGQPLFGAPAKGNKVAWTQTDWLRVSAGRVVARWVSADTLALLQQGGVLPGAG